MPPRKNAKLWKAITAGAVARNKAAGSEVPRSCALAIIARPPPQKPRRNQDALYATTRSRLMARDFDRQVAEFHVLVAVLIGLTALGIPVSKVMG